MHGYQPIRYCNAYPSVVVLLRRTGKNDAAGRVQVRYTLARIMMKIGVISDTHGRVHPRAFELLDGVDHILHAGDIVDAGDLLDLGVLAPVTAVQGNVDAFGPCSRYPEETSITLGNHRFHLVHQVAPLLSRMERGVWEGDMPDVLVYGHSHQGTISHRGNTLLFNPGSAGPRRFQLIPSVGILELDGRKITPRLLALEESEQESLPRV